MLEEIENKFRL